MRFSKPEEGKGGQREERRRARERARDARRRRQELERRAAEIEAQATQAEAAGGEKEPRSAKAKAAKKKRESKRRRLGELPGEIGRRLSLAKLGKLLVRAGRGLARPGRYVILLILTVAALIERLLTRLLRTVRPPLVRVVSALGRIATPTRAAIVIALAAGLAALASQAIDYRAVAIGEEAYAEVASLAQAPLADYRTPWSAHGPLVGLLAVAAAVGAILTLRGGGRRAHLGALGASGAGLLVILGLDLPRAGDLGQATAEYAGTDAVLLEGFYIQLSAMLLLGLIALLPSLWNRKAS